MNSHNSALTMSPSDTCGPVLRLASSHNGEMYTPHHRTTPLQASVKCYANCPYLAVPAIQDGYVPKNS